MAFRGKVVKIVSDTRVHYWVEPPPVKGDGLWTVLGKRNESKGVVYEKKFKTANEAYAEVNRLESLTK